MGGILVAGDEMPNTKRRWCQRVLGPIGDARMKHTWGVAAVWRFLCGCMPPHARRAALQWVGSRGETSAFRPRMDFCGEPVPPGNERMFREALEREILPPTAAARGSLVLYLKRFGGATLSSSSRCCVERRCLRTSSTLPLRRVRCCRPRRSPKEAVGLWQIIPRDGTAIGICVWIHWWMSGAHPERSTQAAIEYLRARIRNASAVGRWQQPATNMGHDALQQQFATAGGCRASTTPSSTRRPRVYIYRILAIKHLLGETRHSFGLAPGSIPCAAGDGASAGEREIPDLVCLGAAAGGLRYRDVRVLKPLDFCGGPATPPPHQEQRTRSCYHRSSTHADAPLREPPAPKAALRRSQGLPPARAHLL
jgi:hypothetical protein